MIDVHSEKPYSFPAVSKQHPTHPSVAALWRWSLHGLRGIRLETVKIGGRRYTSFEAIDRFAARLTAVRSGEQPHASKRRAQDKLRAAQDAKSVF